MKLDYDFRVVDRASFPWWIRLWLYVGSFMTPGSKSDTKAQRSQRTVTNDE
jgi:hypothetical protein